MKKILILLLVIFYFSCDNNKNQSEYQKLAGHAFGTTFHIIHKNGSGQIYEKQIDSLIHLINKSLSTYMPNSDISKINKGDTSIVVDEMFEEVFEKSNKVYRESSGWFDPTIGILVNAWGFGPDENIGKLDTNKIKNMLEKVGFDKVDIINNKIIKKHKETYLDFNALAKGYAVDIIGRFLEKENINNYMVEIGGEIRARGVNAKNKPWLIAIESPNFDGSRTFQTKVELLDESVATSGNYRKFKIDSTSGEKYAHIINPKTGFPIKSNLLSVSVISERDCADVDGYATALMAMGLERSQQFLLNHSDLKVLLIFSDEKGDLKTFASNNFANLEHDHH